MLLNRTLSLFVVGILGASLIAANGRIYIQNEAGETLVIKLGKQYELVARNRSPSRATTDEIFCSSLAASRGQIFVRSNRAIYCIGKQKVAAVR